MIRRNLLISKQLCLKGGGQNFDKITLVKMLNILSIGHHPDLIDHIGHFYPRFLSQFCPPAFCRCCLEIHNVAPYYYYSDIVTIQGRVIFASLQWSKVITYYHLFPLHGTSFLHFPSTYYFYCSMCLIITHHINAVAARQMITPRARMTYTMTPARKRNRIVITMEKAAEKVIGGNWHFRMKIGYKTQLYKYLERWGTCRESPSMRAWGPRCSHWESPPCRCWSRIGLPWRCPRRCRKADNERNRAFCWGCQILT